MSDVHIHRTHELGLNRAREVAERWVAEAGSRFDMVCTVEPGEACDTVAFKRSGVSGRLIVAADHFELHAKLGFLLQAFHKAIEAEIGKNLDALLAREATGGEAS
ncbi:MAG: polyhydroxyalkanoic acid system family protein [Rhizobacter sp.]|jgi:putative polyhydroxyalkanoate system protein